MADLDLVVRGGTVVTPVEAFRSDVGIRDGRIVAVAERLEGRRELDAGGLLVMPGGVDPHCHIEQLEPDGTVHEETFISASASAFSGGTTSVISFVPQFKGQRIAPTLAEYRRRAERSMMDYSFHQIITDPADEVLGEEIPDIIASGIRSLKVFLTYDALHLDDRQFLRVLAVARRYGALVVVHCENYDAIKWRAEALLSAGHTAPMYHSWARPAVVEREAACRAMALAELVDQPIQIFHVSCREVAAEIARAQARGLKVWGETCPQYLVLRASDMERPGFEGAKFICSPSPRDADENEGLWDPLRRGVLDIVSSDHCGYSYQGTKGKRLHGDNAPFTEIPSGVPGLAARLPLAFSEGVAKGRISASEFVRLCAFNPARLFGLYPQKGTIAPGSDADLVLWDPTRRVTLTNALMQHAIDYTPYEGMEVTGWPVATLARGRVVMRDGRVHAEPGEGRFLPRAPYDFIKPRGVMPNGFDPAA
ncbi:MAG: dihydropyrimidinase [Acetobacteraceae bacterium]